MAPKTRRQLAVLAVLLTVLALLLVYNRQEEPAAAGRTAAPASDGRQVVAARDVEVVRLDALARTRPEPESSGRNPFGFRPTAPPPPPMSTARRPTPGGPGALGEMLPSGPPPLPPIQLKFIGLVEQAPTRLKLAVLSDGRNVFYGKEGDTIEGRYRIERIGPESVDMAYLDGRGRQTLRLSGS